MIDTIETRTGVPELQGPDLVCLSAIDKKFGFIFFKHNSVLVFFMDQNPKCPG